MLEQWVKDLTEAVLGGHIPLVVGIIAKHPSGRIAQIVDGQYWDTHGISNFWYWQEIMPDRSPSADKESGYGWQVTEVYSDIEEAIKAMKGEEWPS